MTALLSPAAASHTVITYLPQIRSSFTPAAAPTPPSINLSIDFFAPKTHRPRRRPAAAAGRCKTSWQRKKKSFQLLSLPPRFQSGSPLNTSLLSVLVACGRLQYRREPIVPISLSTPPTVPSRSSVVYWSVDGAESIIRYFHCYR